MSASVGVVLAIVATAAILLLTLWLSLPRIAWWFYRRRWTTDA